MDDEIPMMMEREAGMREDIPMIAVGFGMVPYPDKHKSDKAGHPVYVEREMVHIKVPADKKSDHITFSSEVYRRRFPMAYAAFKMREKGAPMEGYPIEKWPQITRSDGLTLKAMAIQSVEALASVADTNIQNLGPMGREWRAKAQAFLKLSADTAVSQKIAAENQSLRDQLAEQQRQINDLASRLQRDDEPKRRGRPPKAQEEAAA